MNRPCTQSQSAASRAKRTDEAITPTAIVLTVLFTLPFSVLAVLLSLLVTGAILESVTFIVENFLLQQSDWTGRAVHLTALSVKLLAALAFVLPTVCRMGIWITRITSWFSHVGKTRSLRLFRVAGTVSVILAFALFAFAVVRTVGQLPCRPSSASLLISYFYFWLVCVLSIYFRWAQTTDELKGTPSRFAFKPSAQAVSPTSKRGNSPVSDLRRPSGGRTSTQAQEG